MFGSQSENGNRQTVLLSEEPAFRKDRGKKGEKRRESPREEEARWPEARNLWWLRAREAEHCCPRKGPERVRTDPNVVWEQQRSRGARNYDGRMYPKYHLEF